MMIMLHSNRNRFQPAFPLSLEGRCSRIAAQLNQNILISLDQTAIERKVWLHHLILGKHIRQLDPAAQISVFSFDFEYKLYSLN